MRVKLKSFRKSGQTSFICQNPAGGNIVFKSVGDVVEVEEGFGYQLLASYGDMLEKDEGSAPKAEKSVKKYEDKSLKAADDKAAKVESTEDFLDKKA